MSEDNYLPYVAVFLGLLCVGLLTLIILIASKRAKGCRGGFCLRRRVEGEEVPSSAIANRRTPGCSSPPQTSHGEETIPVYAAIDIKKQKDSTRKKSLRLDLVSAKKPTATYFAADGTEYQTMTASTAAAAAAAAGSDPRYAEKSVASPPPPMQQPRLFETSTYASIDHGHAVPQPKAMCK